MLFQDFAQLVAPEALNAPPLAGLGTAPAPDRRRPPPPSATPPPAATAPAAAAADARPRAGPRARRPPPRPPPARCRAHRPADGPPSETARSPCGSSGRSSGSSIPPLVAIAADHPPGHAGRAVRPEAARAGPAAGPGLRLGADPAVDARAARPVRAGPVPRPVLGRAAGPVGAVPAGRLRRGPGVAEPAGRPGDADPVRLVRRAAPWSPLSWPI